MIILRIIECDMRLGYVENIRGKIYGINVPGEEINYNKLKYLFLKQYETYFASHFNFFD